MLAETTVKKAPSQLLKHIIKYAALLLFFTYLLRFVTNTLVTEIGFIFKLSFESVWLTSPLIELALLPVPISYFFYQQALNENHRPFWTGFAILMIFILTMIFIGGPYLLIPAIVLIYFLTTLTAINNKKNNVAENKKQKLLLIIPGIMLLIATAVTTTVTAKVMLSRSLADNAYSFYEYKEYKPALMLVNKAIKQGDPKAEYLLSSMYFFGQGVKKDNDKALAWLNKSAQQGYADANFDLGVIYKAGSYGLPVDYTKAAYFYQKAVDKGHVFAAANLAILYAEGLGVKKDPAKFQELTQFAASHGDGVAMYNIGLDYKNANTPDHYKIAAEWFRKSMQHYTDFNPCSPNDLGMLYASGKGVEKDPMQARKYLLLSAAVINEFTYTTGGALRDDLDKAPRIETRDAFVELQSGQPFSKKYSPLAIKTAKEMSQFIADKCWK